MASTRKFQRAVIDAARRLAEAHGGTAVMVQEQHRGHPYIEIVVRGVRRRHAMSCSPRDQDNALRMVVQDVKRMIREILNEKAPAV